MPKTKIATLAVILLVVTACSVAKIVSVFRQAKFTEIAFETVIREQKLVNSMSYALQVEYNLSPVEADCYAMIYRKHSGVRWTLLAATTYVESHFDPTLTSHAGAQGLMQLMKPTREGLCAAHGIANNNTTPWRDVVNLDLGCDYLTSLIVKYRDTLGVAAYNVGPANLDTFKTSQQAFIDLVFSHERRLAIIFKGVQ